MAEGTRNYKRLIAPVTYMVSSEDVVIDVDTTLGVATIFIPNIQADATLDRKIYINDATNNASVFPITVNTIGGNTINNVLSLPLDADGISAQIIIVDRNRYMANLNNDSGSGGGSTFINPNPTTITAGGYPAGSTFPIAQTMQQMWNNLLYPYIPPAFISFGIGGQSSLIEVGVALSGIKTFNWATSQPANVQVNSIAIRDVTANVLIASGLANSGSANANIGVIANTAPISQNWRGEAVDSQLAPFNSGNFNVSSIYPIFYGKVASGGAPPGGNRPLSNQALINSGTKLVIPSGGTVTLTFGTTADDYMWFAIPSTSPLKTIWYVNALNTGSIGGAVAPGGNLFPAPDLVSVNSPTALWAGVNYDIYVANYQSAVILPIELRNS